MSVKPMTMKSRFCYGACNLKYSLVAASLFFQLTTVVLAQESPSKKDSSKAQLRSSTSKLEEGFVAMFDGLTLDGWSAVPENTGADWSVRDGAIVGVGSADRQIFLVWKDREVADFELRLQYRLLTKGNTGIEIRAHPDATRKRPFQAYHADIGHVDIGPNVLGAWDFHFANRKEHACPRGTSLVIDDSDQPHSAKIDNALSPDDVRSQDWNDVRVIAIGNRCQFFINGKLASEFTDNFGPDPFRKGAIGLQLHNRGMRVEFGDLRIRIHPGG